MPVPKTRYRVTARQEYQSLVFHRLAKKECTYKGQILLHVAGVDSNQCGVLNHYTTGLHHNVSRLREAGK